MITAHVPPFDTVGKVFPRNYSLEEYEETATRERKVENYMNSKINPEHYSNTEIEPIDVIEDWKLGFHLGNAIKYIKRAGQKGEESFEDDISKAVWYLQRSIQK